MSLKNLKTYDENHSNVKAIIQLFNKFDHNKDEKIEKQQLVELLQHIFKQSGINMTSKSTTHYSKLFDDDQNESISKDEFVLMLLKFDQPIKKA